MFSIFALAPAGFRILKLFGRGMPIRRTQLIDKCFKTILIRIQFKTSLIEILEAIFQWNQKHFFNKMALLDYGMIAFIIFQIQIKKCLPLRYSIFFFFFFQIFSAWY